MPVWVARAGRNGENEAFAMNGNVAVVGWDEVSDLSDMSERPNLLPLLVDNYPDEAENTLKNWETQLWAFSHRIAKGDVLVLPRKRTSTVAFGLVAGEYRYDETAAPGCRHQLPVKWIKKDIPRQSIDSDLRFSIGGAMTVFQVRRNRAEERIRAMLDGRELPLGRDTQNADPNDDDVDASSIPDVERFALDQISDHISRKFRGHELERLVEAVLLAHSSNIWTPIPIVCGQ